VRVVAGPHVRLLPAGLLEALLGTAWAVGAQSDRTGLRLEGPALPSAGSAASGGWAGLAGRMVSQPMVWGAIQVTPEGLPICLLADHQTVGGYPVAAVVISADRPLIGQLGPGDELTLSLVTLAEAEAALHEQKRRLAALAARLAPVGGSAG
jgi:allophanate hydrolase subunit 2